MKTTLETLTVADLTAGFQFSELEGKGLYGLNGSLVIQPEYQRNYIYGKYGKDAAVIQSLLKEYPLGLMYFNQAANGQLEVLDGQQRITSIGRFLTDRFSIQTDAGPRIFSSLDAEQQALLTNSKLLVYICDGTETEIKQWFDTINIAGVQLTDQELLNAIYSGTFVSAARKELSNTANPQMLEWSRYLSGDPNRQDYLETALKWISNGQPADYMNKHRKDADASPLLAHFTEVIKWASSFFPMPSVHKKQVDWGHLHRLYGLKPYNPSTLSTRVTELMSDPFVTNPKGIFEYVLGEEADTKLLNIRVFSENIKRAKHAQQTGIAEKTGQSNCPDCASQGATTIHPIRNMDADHVTAWSRGGASDISNCQMLCKRHNKIKGNL